MINRFLTIALFICFSFVFNLSLAEAKTCKKESLIEYTYDGRPVSSEFIGKDDACDGFGGDLVYTPKNKIYFYVNFNIPGHIELRDIDDIFDLETAKLEPNMKKTLRAVEVAVVTHQWMVDYKGGALYALNYLGNIYFISEKILAEGRLDEAMSKLYSGEAWLQIK